jgi:hypothetical protein
MFGTSKISGAVRKPFLSPLADGMTSHLIQGVKTREIGGHQLNCNANTSI